MPEASRLKKLDIAMGFALVWAIGFGAVIRFAPVLSAQFPLNDGGMVYTLAEDLRENHYVAPVYTTYNLAQIPYVYPPLAFYVLALLSDITGADLLLVLRVLPAAISVLTIPAFFLLARAISPAKPVTAIAVVAFAFLPRSFEWLIMGGGLTRALGFLFALLALSQIYGLYTRGGRRFLLTATLFSSLTILSHPEAAWYTFYSAALFFLFFGRSWAGVRRSLLVAVGVLLLTAVWWAPVLRMHGVEPLIAATGSHAGSSWGYLLTFDFTSELFLDLLAMFGLLGLFWAFARREYFLPVWMIAIFLFESRSANTLAMAPLAILVGIGITTIILRCFSPDRDATLPDTPWPEQLLQTRTARILLAFVLFYTMFYAFMFTIFTPVYRTLPSEELEAMQWISENTLAGSRFLVISGSGWWKDACSEWFPVLTKRASLMTVQGSEWLPASAFEGRERQHESLQFCVDLDIHCLQAWLDKTPVAFTHIYLSDLYASYGPGGNDYPDDLPRFPKLYYSLKESPEYHLIYEQFGVAVFEKGVKP